MKKYLCLSLICLGLLFFTGCNRKVLKCSIVTDYGDGFVMKQDLNISFGMNKVSTLSMNMNVTCTDSYLDHKDDLIKDVEEKFLNYEGEKGINYATDVYDNGFDFNLNVNFNKLSRVVKDSLGIINYEGSYDSIKSELEDSGFECK